jgi:hypothetical protein
MHSDKAGATRNAPKTGWTMGAWGSARARRGEHPHHEPAVGRDGQRSLRTSASQARHRRGVGSLRGSGDEGFYSWASRRSREVILRGKTVQMPVRRE